MTVHYLHMGMGFAAVPEDNDTDEGFDAFTDKVMDELMNLQDVDDGIIDPDVTVRITDRYLEVSMGIEADSCRDASRLFSANVRTALHAAECFTPDWPTYRPADDELPKPSVLEVA